MSFLLWPKRKTPVRIAGKGVDRAHIASKCRGYINDTLTY